jgi:hypothetical protein
MFLTLRKHEAVCFLHFLSFLSSCAVEPHEVKPPIAVPDFTVPDFAFVPIEDIGSMPDHIISFIKRMQDSGKCKPKSAVTTAQKGKSTETPKKRLVRQSDLDDDDEPETGQKRMPVCFPSYHLTISGSCLCWTTSDVAAFLERIELPQYIQSFRHAEITGERLQQGLNDDDYNTLGVAHPLHQKKITRRFAKQVAQG